jgi:tetratricopeptide (TPR) repeat protein
MRASLRAFRFTLAVLLSALAYTPAQAAWDFIPTGLEWASWPEYCRVQYSWVNAGFEFQYGGRYPNDAVDRWRRTIGDNTFTGMHHWCASLHFLNRARSEPEPKMRNFELNRASEDAMFSFLRADPASPVYPDMAVTVAQIREAMGKPDEAVEVLQRGIDAQPRRAEAYVVLALLDRKQHRLPDARDVLKRADDVTGGKSAEVQYNLGLINLEIGDAESAHGNAVTAYSLGYPLPGLKNKLRKVGRWSDADERTVAAALAAANAAQASGGPAAVAPAAPPGASHPPAVSR